MPPTLSQNHALQVRSSQSDGDKNKLDKIRLYKTQCEDILRRHYVATRGNQVLPEQRERLRLVFSCIVEKLNVWSKWDEIDTFAHHEAMKSDLRDLHRRLDAAMAPDIDFREADDERTKGQGARDAQELKILVNSIFQSPQDMAKLANMLNQQKRRSDVEGIMKFAQLELMGGALTRDEVAIYHEALWYLYNKTKTLPPMATLNGQIVLKPHDLVGQGPARWLNRKPVLLHPLPKALAQHRELRPDFEMEVLKWRELDHSHNNLAPIYGIIDLGSDIYMVSSWTKQGTLLNSAAYRDGSMDHLKCLIEIASGLEYLHNNGIIHGSLYAGNILVSEDGKACIAYYGITSFLEKHGSGLIDMAEIADYRRSAPEITIGRQPLSMASDTWSFGMMALEMLTGKQPFDDISPDIWILSHLERLQHITCKLSERIDTAYSLSSDVKRFLDECWNFDPLERASVDVLERLKRVNNSQLLQGSLIGFRIGESTNHLLLLEDDISESSRRSSVEHPVSEPMWASTLYTQSSRSLSPLSIQFNGQGTLPKGTGDQTLEPLAIAPGPATPTRIQMQAVRQISNPTVPHSVRRPSQSSSLQPQQDKPAYVRRGSHSTTSGIPPATPSKTQSLVTIPPVSYRPNTATSHERPTTSGSGPSKMDPIVSPGSVCGSASVLTNAVGRYSQMHSRIVYAFGSPDEYQQALLESCSYIKDTRYQCLTSTSSLDFTTENDLQYQVFRDVILSLSRPHSSFLRTYMPRLKDMCKRFANMADNGDISSQHVDKPSDLQIYIEKRPDFQLPNVPGSLGEIKTLSPVEMAHALAFFQAEKYCAIDPSSDYLDHLILEGSSSSINEALKVHDAIVLWAQNYILTCKSLHDRFYTVIYLMNVAEGCKKIANLASMFAIGEALHDENISKLPVLDMMLAGNSHIKERRQKLSRNMYEVRIKKAPNVYIPYLRYHLEGVKSTAGNAQSHGLPSLKEINALIGEAQKKLSSLPMVKPSQEGEKFSIYIKSQLNPFIGEIEGHKSRLKIRHGELRKEEDHPSAVAEAKKILENFKKGSFN